MLHPKTNKVLKQNAATLDIARGSNVQRCLLCKNAIYSLIEPVDPNCYDGLFRFNEVGCPFSEIRILTKSKKFIENLSIIFSGSHNSGHQIFQEKDMPFEIVEEEMDVSAHLKRDWQDKFTSASVMHRDIVEKSLLDSIFIRRKSETSSFVRNGDRKSSIVDRCEVHPAATVSSADSNYHRMSSDKFTPTHYHDYDISDDFLDNISTEGSSRSLPTLNAQVVPLSYDLSDGPNRGTARVRNGDVEIDGIDFNMDATALPGKKFEGKHGTHKWKLLTNFDRDNETLFRAGDYLSVTSITSASKVVFLSPFPAELDMVPHKYYTIGVKYFIAHNNICGTPTSLNSN